MLVGKIRVFLTEDSRFIKILKRVYVKIKFDTLFYGIWILVVGVW